MRHTVPVLMVLAMTTIGQTAHTQDHIYNLPKIWETAILFNKELKLQTTEVERGQEWVKDAQTARLPEVSIGGSYSRLSDMPLYEHGLFHQADVVAINSTSYNTGIEASLTLYDGGKLSRNIAIMKAQLQSLERGKQLTLAQIKLRTSQCFFDLIRYLEFQRLVETEIVQDKKLIKDISSLYKNGTVLKSDVLRADLKFSNHLMLLKEIQNNISLNTQQLNILMGRDDEAPLIPDATLTSTSNNTLLEYEDYVKLGMDEAFELKIVQGEIAIKELQIKQLKHAVLPKLSFFTSYNYNYPQSKYYPYATAMFGMGQVGLKISIPISNLYLNQHKQRAAILSRDYQITGESAKKDQIRNEIKTHYLRYIEALERIEIAQKSIVQATESLRILRNSYFNQQSLLTDLLDSETQLLQTQFDRTTAQVTAQIHYYQLQRIIGKI